MADTKAIILRTSTPRSSIDRRMWATTSGRNIVSSGTGNIFSSAYSFFIFDLVSNEIVSIPDIDPARRTGLALYQFPMAPQQYECSEPASTTVTPTQDGGKFVESHGSQFKDIRIGGTIGFRPSPASTEIIPGLAKATGVQLSIPSRLQQFFNDERGLSPKEATGFDDIIFLRNIFRSYWDYKQDPELSRRLVLVWVYAKESESWVVEPMQFVTNRDASKPLSWTYQIQLRTLYPLGFSFSVVEDSLGFFGGLAKGINAIQGMVQAIKDIGKFINQISGLINYIVKLPFKIVNDIIDGAMSVMSSLSNIINTNDFSKFPDDTVKKWQSALREAHYIVTGVSNNSSIPTNPLSPREFTDNPWSNLPANPRPSGGSTQDSKDGDAAKVIKDGMRVANFLVTSDIFHTQSKQVVVKDYSAAYLNEFGEPPFTAGSPLNIANISIPGSAKQVLIEGGEDIRSIAKRLLGDEAYWKLLAVLNNLKAPYIAPVSSPGVLAYGDPILIPKSLSPIEAQSGVSSITNPDADSEALTPILRRYGRDIRLTSTEEGLGDLGVSQRGDFDLIESLDNVYQAVMIKFSTEQGELATHPTFGAKYPIGTKFPSLSRLQEFRINTHRTLHQDPRIKEVDELSIYVDADQILVDARVSLQGADSQLPISFTVRR